MLLARQTLTNWLAKGAEMLEKLLPALKAKALAPGSIVNVDETWGRLHLVRKSGKIYVWCQAHARAKFKYAQEQGRDDRATYFLERIAKLYQIESEYKRLNLSFDEIKSRRNSAETSDIQTEMSCELKRLRDDGSPKSDLMEKALNYLDHFWKQIFDYRNDGRYSIDNSIAEQCIRPLTRERSNSIHFASHRGAEVSAVFHTIFSTCRMVGVSALDYLKRFFEAMLAGRTDYENLLPSTIGLNS